MNVSRKKSVVIVICTREPWYTHAWFVWKHHCIIIHIWNQPIRKYDRSGLVQSASREWPPIFSELNCRQGYPHNTFRANKSLPFIWFTSVGRGNAWWTGRGGAWFLLGILVFGVNIREVNEKWRVHLKCQQWVSMTDWSVLLWIRMNLNTSIREKMESWWILNFRPKTYGVHFLI